MYITQYMPTATKIIPKRAESIRDVVAPQRFDSAQLWLELPADAKATERVFYENLPDRVHCSRAGGVSYPTLDICIDKHSFNGVLDELKKYPRLVYSVMFLEGREWPQSVVEAYLLQGAERIKTDLF